MKPGPPAKAGPAPPAGADGNCSSSGRGSLQLIVVRNLTACSTRSRTGTAVKRGGRPGQLHTDRPCSLEPVPALTRAPSRADPTLPPRLGARCEWAGRSARRRSFDHSSDRPPGHPPVAAFDPHSYQPSRTPSPPAPTLSLRATGPQLFRPGWGATFMVAGTDNTLVVEL